MLLLLLLSCACRCASSVVGLTAHCEVCGWDVCSYCMQQLRQQLMEQQQVTGALPTAGRCSSSSSNSSSFQPGFKWTCCNPDCGETKLSSSSSSQRQQQGQLPVVSGDGSSSSQSQRQQVQQQQQLPIKGGGGSSSSDGSGNDCGHVLPCQSGKPQLSVKLLLPEDLAAAGAAAVLDTLAAVAQVCGCLSGCWVADSGSAESLPGFGGMWFLQYCCSLKHNQAQRPPNRLNLLLLPALCLPQAPAGTTHHQAAAGTASISCCPLLPPGAHELLPLLTVPDGSRGITLADLQGGGRMLLLLLMPWGQREKDTSCSAANGPLANGHRCGVRFSGGLPLHAAPPRIFYTCP